MLRRELTLPEEDIKYLDYNHYEWETIHSNGPWLLIHNYPLPMGYNVSQVSIAIYLASYAPGPLDMVYVYPPLYRVDGKIIGQVQVMQPIDGKSYQRWSRHYPWDNKKNSLITHLIQIEEWFKNEFDKR